MLFTKDGKSDSKHILNTTKKIVPNDMLERIERGITLEDLDVISKSYDVYKYQTQITIHGLFGELKNNYVAMYKNIFQNKNKSIGIRWNAIDCKKRLRLFERLGEILGFRTVYNSQELFCWIIRDYNEQNLKELRTIYDRIDSDLFIGRKDLFSAVYYYRKIIVLQLNINAFYERDFDKIILSACGGEDGLKAILRDIEIRRAKEEAERLDNEKRQAELQEKIRKIFEEKTADLRAQGWTMRIPQVGDVWVTYNRRIDEFKYYKLVKSFGRTIRKECDKDGNPSKNKGFEVNIADERLCRPRIEEAKKESSKVVKKNKSSVPSVVNADGVKIVDYNERSFAVVGDTKPIKDVLKQNGGRFNKYLSCGVGWIFPITKKDTIKRLLSI